MVRRALSLPALFFALALVGGAALFSMVDTAQADDILQAQKLCENFTGVGPGFVLDVLDEENQIVRTTGELDCGTAAGFSTLPNGIYHVDERPEEGWVQTGNTCSDIVIDGEDGTFSCEITNTFVGEGNGAIQVFKNCDPFLPDAGEDQFTLSLNPIAGGDEISLPSVTCGGNTGVVAVVPSEYGVEEAPVAGNQYTWALDLTGCGTNGTVTIVEGELVTCIVTNRLAALVIQKNCSEGGVDPPFAYSINGDAQEPGLNCSDTVVFEADPEISYTVTEEAGDYTTTYDNCVDVQVALGEQETCTITNLALTGTLTVNKDCPPNFEGNMDTFDIVVTQPEVGGSQLAGGTVECGGSASLNLVPGDYWVEEVPVAGNVLTYFPDLGQCGEATGADGFRQVTISVNQTTECTIVNQTSVLVIDKVCEGGVEGPFDLTIDSTPNTATQIGGGGRLSAGVGAFQMQETTTEEIECGGRIIVMGLATISVTEAEGDYETTHDNCDVDLGLNEIEVCTITNTGDGEPPAAGGHAEQDAGRHERARIRPGRDI